jgi:hypothetical protein
MFLFNKSLYKLNQLILRLITSELEGKRGSTCAFLSTKMEVVKRQFSIWSLVLVVGMLFTGTLNTITQKIQNDAVSNGTKGIPHEFQHPWYFH